MSPDLTELLVLRRLVLETLFAVETARSARQALELLAANRYAAVIVDDTLGAEAEDLLGDLALRCPDMVRVLLERDGTLLTPPSTERIRRPFYAAALRTRLTELALRKVELRASDDTLRTPLLFNEDGL